MSLLIRCQPSIRIASRIATNFPARNYCAPKVTEAKSSDANRPIRFTGSTAASMYARDMRQGTTKYEDVPWYQTYVVCGSVAIFLIYFCILREENDVDLEFEKSLYDRVPGLESTQLVINYKYNLENSNDNTDIVKRMKELGMRPEDIKF